MGGLNDQDLIEELCDIETGLNGWEVEFVEAMAKRVLNDRLPLTPNMREKAEQIFGNKAHDR